MSQSGSSGVAVSELPPETQTKRALSKWLKGHGVGVSWEKKNPFGYDIFHVNDSPEKPDLLLHPFGYNIAVEVKNGEEKSATYDALLQTQQYWQQYRDGETEYTLNGETVNIDGFVVGNEHSIGGRLFFEDYETLIQWSQFGDGRREDVKRGKLPRMGEYSMTELYTRMQWRVAKQDSSRISTGIGALLSTALDGEIDNPKPAILWWHKDAQGWLKL